MGLAPTAATRAACQPSTAAALGAAAAAGTRDWALAGTPPALLCGPPEEWPPLPARSGGRCRSLAPPRRWPPPPRLPTRPRTGATQPRQPLRQWDCPTHCSRAGCASRATGPIGGRGKSGSALRGRAQQRFPGPAGTPPCRYCGAAAPAPQAGWVNHATRSGQAAPAAPLREASKAVTTAARLAASTADRLPPPPLPQTPSPRQAPATAAASMAAAAAPVAAAGGGSGSSAHADTASTASPSLYQNTSTAFHAAAPWAARRNERMTPT